MLETGHGIADPRIPASFTDGHRDFVDACWPHHGWLGSIDHGLADGRALSRGALGSHLSTSAKQRELLGCICGVLGRLAPNGPGDDVAIGDPNGFCLCSPD